MKNLTSLLLITVLCVFGLPACAAPLPQKHNNNVTLTVDPTTQPEVAVTVTFYRSMPRDAFWTVAGTATASAGSVVVTNAQYGELFYATFSDALGNESDPSNVSTNLVTFAPPGQIKITR